MNFELDLKRRSFLGVFFVSFANAEELPVPSCNLPAPDPGAADYFSQVGLGVQSLRPNYSTVSNGSLFLKDLENAYQLDTDNSRDAAFLKDSELHNSMCTKYPHVHGCLDFLTWHRAFLIVHEYGRRKRANVSKDFRLGCWDWDQEIQGSRLIPKPFLSGGLNASRNNELDLNKDLGSESFGIRLEELKSASSTDLLGVSRLIEVVHLRVHQICEGDMSLIETAATDPIFYAHHAQVDRLFGYWLEVLGGRNEIEKNKRYSDWLKNTRYQFQLPGGPLVYFSVRDLIDSKKLSYFYDYGKLGGLLGTSQKITNRYRFTLKIPNLSKSGYLEAKIRKNQTEILLYRGVVEKLNHRHESSFPLEHSIDIILSDHSWEKIKRVANKKEIEIAFDNKSIADFRVK